jgi:formylglycine-generating enzyme required for sulfatase activity
MGDFAVLARAVPSAHRETNVFGIDLIWVSPGTFQMGCDYNPGGHQWWNNAEQPVHTVRITTGFWMAKYEITRAKHSEIMGSAPPSTYPTKPHVGYAWNEANAVCTRLDELTMVNWDLPTEAEWEYAYRAGTKTYWYCGDTITPADGNYGTNYQHTEYYEQWVWPMPVGMFPPNPWGFYDILANAREYVKDWYSETGYYPVSPIDDPQGPERNPATGVTNKTTRGGGMSYNEQHCRAAARNLASGPARGSNSRGVRPIIHP